MNQYTVTPIFQNTFIQHKKVHVPGSKSITNRALLLSALSKGTSTLHNILISDDSLVFIKALEDLSFDISFSPDTKELSITGKDDFSSPKDGVYVGSAGTAARFLSVFLAFCKMPVTLHSSDQMKKRPMAPLIDALRFIGVTITCLEEEGHFPFSVQFQSQLTNEVSINIDESSQFLSALLMSGILLEDGITIHTTGTRLARSYVDITTSMMSAFGVTVSRPDHDTYVVPSHMHYHALDYFIEPDFSSACYFFAMATILGETIQVLNTHLDSIQGDAKFLSVLTSLGAMIEDRPDGICVTGPSLGQYPGVDVDLSDCSDQSLTLAAIAVFATSPTTIRGISHIRRQESDRIHAINENITRLGGYCEEFDDGITIYPPASPLSCEIETYDDHRVAMSFALVGLRTKGITILDPLCCQKTFPDFFTILDELTT